MKKTIFILILFISNFSIASDKVTISGKITNCKLDKFMIQGEKFSNTILINKNGEFKSIIDIKYIGIYNIHYDNLNFKLYLSKDSNIIFDANENDFLNSLNFKGALSTENNYLIKKQLTTSKIIGSEEEFFKLNESDFLTKLNVWKTEVIKLYNTTKYKDFYFKTHEIKNIDYTESYFYIIFSLFHHTDDGKSTLSENYPKNKMVFNYDFNNTEDYLFSEIYLTMIDSEWYNHIQRLTQNSTESIIKIKIEEVKKIKNIYLKNEIIENLISQIKPQNADLDYLHNELIKLINDENLSKEVTEKYNTVKKLLKGSPSPSFNYENYNSGSTSLESLRGKYIYIDVWATWCGPCLMEIPNLEKLQNTFKDKNISFVSISVDKKIDVSKWRKLIEEKNLGGIQLITDNERKSDFLKQYAVSSIPRFILIDKEGNIIDADAPRPSNPKLIEIFNNLP